MVGETAQNTLPRAGRFATKTGFMAYRRMVQADRTAMYLHLDKLSDADRGARFSSDTLDPDITSHCAQIDFTAMQIYGTFMGAELIGVAELRPQSAKSDATIVLSVQEEFRRLGVAAGLLGVALRGAEQSGIVRRVVYCLPENVPMRCLMARAGFIETLHEGMVVGSHERPVAKSWPGCLVGAAN